MKSRGDDDMGGKKVTEADRSSNWDGAEEKDLVLFASANKQPKCVKLHSLIALSPTAHLQLSRVPL